MVFRRSAVGRFRRFWVQNSLDAFLAVEKYLLVKRGIFPSARVRGPVGYELDAETRAEVDRLFAKLQEALADTE